MYFCSGSFNIVYPKALSNKDNMLSSVGNEEEKHKSGNNNLGKCLIVFY